MFGILGLVPPARANTPVTITKHLDLGFTSSIPINLQTGDVCDFSFLGCIFQHNLGFVGTADIKVDLGVDMALTYDPSLLVPGGSLPVTVTYTPTPGGSTAAFDVAGTGTVDFTFCTDCPFTSPFTITSGSATFTAPMGGDSPISIPGTGSTFDIGGLISATAATTVTLGPAPAGSLAGLGGAAALVSVTGATTSQVLPIEWDSSGASQIITLTLPSTPGPIDISMGPIVHWLTTSGTAAINLHWGSTVDTLYAAGVITACGLIPFPADIGCVAAAGTTPSDPSPISVFSGNLGQFYTMPSVHLDTTIGNAVATAVGPPLGTIIGNDIATNVAAGELPIPLLSPPLASFPPVPSLGSIDFGIPFAAITGAPSTDLLLGNSIDLHAIPSGGTGPYTFAWTKNGGAFGGTSELIDTPSLGTTTYAVTITDSEGAVSNTASVTVNVYDFSMSVTPSSLQVLTTGSNTYTPGAAVSLVSGSVTTGLPTIGLSVTGGLPSGTTSTFTPASGSASGFTSTLLIATSGAPAGTYTLTVAGTDSTPLTGGSRTTTTSLTVLTPAQALPQVITTIGGLHASGALNGGQANSLIVKLNHAIDKLNAGQTTTACNQLTAFVNEVNAYVATGVLTAAEANSLLGGPLGVLAIMASIPC